MRATRSACLGERHPRSAACRADGALWLICSLFMAGAPWRCGRRAPPAPPGPRAWRPRPARAARPPGSARPRGCTGSGCITCGPGPARRQVHRPHGAPVHAGEPGRAGSSRQRWAFWGQQATAQQALPRPTGQASKGQCCSGGPRLGHVGAGEDEAAGGRVLLHGAPQAVLRLLGQAVHLVQDQHLVAALPAQLERPVFAHLLRSHRRAVRQRVGAAAWPGAPRDQTARCGRQGRAP